MSSPFGVGDSAFRHSQAEQWTDSVPFGAYRRAVFERIGGFAEDIDRGEDDEFNYRLRQNGGRILLTPSVGSEYYARSTLWGLWRQYWGYGLAKVAVLQRHPQRLRARHLVPSAFVLTLAGGALLSLLDRRLGWLAALAGGAYLVVNAIASLRIARQGHTRALPYLPAAFATIHVAAGAGMIAGLLRTMRSKSRHDR
jgi:GT2 family glycosyltransferase